LGTIPLVAGVVTILRMSAKNSVLKLIDYTTYVLHYVISFYMAISRDVTP